MQHSLPEQTRTFEAKNLPASLVGRKETLEKAVKDVTDLVFESPLPSLNGLRITSPSKDTLHLEHMDDPKIASYNVNIRADGTIDSVVHEQYGTSMRSEFEWDQTHPERLQRVRIFDPRRPHERVIQYDVDYAPSKDSLSLPKKISLRIDGLLPKVYEYQFTYPYHGA